MPSRLGLQPGARRSLVGQQIGLTVIREAQLTRTPRSLTRAWMRIGIFGQVELAATRFELHRGEALLAYTDGLTEARR